jgi:hypothetical protein
VNPDIWGDVGAFNGSPYEFSLILKDPDYGIPTKNIWILDSNPKSFSLGMEFRTSKRSDPFE